MHRAIAVCWSRGGREHSGNTASSQSECRAVLHGEPRGRYSSGSSKPAAVNCKSQGGSALDWKAYAGLTRVAVTKQGHWMRWGHHGIFYSTV